jgi:cytochrome d ubiquinol oxidase subunit I
VLGISAWHLFRKNQVEFFKRSFTIASIFGSIAILLVVLAGHSQAQEMVRAQPMKMAAAEALWYSMDPASFSLITIGNEPEMRDVWAIRIPGVLSLLAYNRLEGEVKGIHNLQAEYEALYGPGDYSPPIAITYWTFRIMVGAGFLMLALAAYSLYHTMRRLPFEKFPFLKYLPYALLLPYLANTAGWIMTEMGRQPWIVFGLMKTEDAFSPNLTVGMVLTTLIGFTLIYGVLMAADVYLLKKFAKAGPLDVTPSLSTEEHSLP